jgi:protein-S-isoprenylcysteine O-methyltransferase Ste14
MTTTEIAVRLAIPALWLAWIVYWIVAARGAKPTRWREGTAASALHGVPFALCILLLAAPQWQPAVLTEPMWPRGLLLPLVGTVLVVAGLGFAVWARVHLGANWSSLVVLKEDHALVRDGPYRLVRHPIYSGILLAVLGTALAIGEGRGVLALAAVLIGILFRVRAEEARMSATFPEYRRYREQSWALIPLVY